MKKARQITIPDSKIITQTEYEDYYNHAKNSSLWYLNNFNRNSNQIRQKLYDKGYPKDEVFIVEDKLITKDIDRNLENEEISKQATPVNIVEEIITLLTENSLIDDIYYIENMLEAQLNKGKSLSLAKQVLINTKKVDRNLLNEVISKMDEIEELEEEGLNKVALKTVNSSMYQRKDKFQRKQYLYQRLLRSGYSSADISSWIENNLE